MLKKILDSFLKDYETDYSNKNYKFSSLLDKIEELENRIIKLEDENISLTNELYRLENSLESKFEVFLPSNQNLSQFKIGDT